MTSMWLASDHPCWLSKILWYVRALLGLTCIPWALVIVWLFFLSQESIVPCFNGSGTIGHGHAHSHGRIRQYWEVEIKQKNVKDSKKLVVHEFCLSVVAIIWFSLTTAWSESIFNSKVLRMLSMLIYGEWAFERGFRTTLAKICFQIPSQKKGYLCEFEQLLPVNCPHWHIVSNHDCIENI